MWIAQRIMVSAASSLVGHPVMVEWQWKMEMAECHKRLTAFHVHREDPLAHTPRPYISPASLGFTVAM